jgi:putative MATE family efflux protein
MIVERGIQMLDTGEKSSVTTFLRYSIPCILGMFLTSFIIVVDGIFIGWKVGKNGLAAVNLTLPVLYVLLAITTLIGVGGVTLAAQSLGAKENAKANYYFSFSLLTILVINVMLVGGFAVFQDEMIILLGAKGILYPYVKDFLGVLLYFYIFMMLNIAFSMFIRAEGKPQLSLVFGVAGNIINILLDYVFIARWEWGMSGAALASGIATLLPFLFGLWYFLKSKSVYQFCKFSITFCDFKNILKNGAAECIAQISVSITTILFNRVLLERMGVNGVAALTIIGYVMFIHNMIITGMAIGIHPVISYHFGAKKVEVITRLLTTAVKVVMMVGIFLFIVSLTGAEKIIGVFSGENRELLSIGKMGLRCFSMAFLLSGYNIIATAFFTSIGETTAAALVSVLRSLVLLVVFLMVLPYILGDMGIWFTAPLTEMVTFIVAYFLMNRTQAKLAAGKQG